MRYKKLRLTFYQFGNIHDYSNCARLESYGNLNVDIDMEVFVDAGCCLGEFCRETQFLPGGQGHQSILSNRCVRSHSLFHSTYQLESDDCIGVEHDHTRGGSKSQSWCENPGREQCKACLRNNVLLE